MPSRRVLILFNPVSGAGRAARLAEAARQELAAAGHDVITRATEREGSSVAGEHWLTPHLGDREAVAVVGGDGAVRAVLSPLAERDIAVWHLPAGTENLVARAFGMVAAPRALAVALDRWETRPIDLGVFAERGIHEGAARTSLFAIMASIGFDAHVIHDLNAHRRGAITHWTYIPAIARTLAAWRPTEVTISLDGGEARELGAGVLIVANMSEYGFRIDPVRHAKADDGLLDAVFLPASTGIGALSWGPALILTRRLLGREARNVERFQARSMRVATRSPSRWQSDGDPIEGGRPDGIGVADISVRPAALRVLLPPPTW